MEGYLRLYVLEVGVQGKILTGLTVALQMSTLSLACSAKGPRSCGIEALWLLNLNRSRLCQSASSETGI